MKVPAHLRWPAAIVGALAVHGVAWLAVVYLATSNPSYAVEEDYYSKALAWDAGRAQDRVNTSLGWRVEIAVEPVSAPGRQPEVVATLVDRDGLAVESAAVSLEAFHNARAADVLHADLLPEGGGRYRAALPMRRNGLWELRLSADVGSHHFTHRELRHLSVSRPRRSR